jgi:hypothetical protein
MTNEEIVNRLLDLEKRVKELESKPAITGMIGGVQHEWMKMPPVEFGLDKFSAMAVAEKSAN